MGSYKFPDTLADRTGSQICHCEEAAGRRGALSAKREEVPLGCNLGKALPNCTGHCRGADSRARRNAADSNGPPLKWQRLPDLSLRGRFAPVAISGRQLRFRRKYPIIRPSTARFPRRFSPRNGNSDSLAPPNHHCNTRNCCRRSLSAATDAIGLYVLSLPCTNWQCLTEMTNPVVCADFPLTNGKAAATIAFVQV